MKNRNIQTIIEIIILVIIAMPWVLAANDPGHDTLYVLKVGDTITGNLNISQNLNVTQNATIQGKKLDVGALTFYGDGTTISSGSTMTATTTNITVDATNLFLKWNVGSNNVYIGQVGASAVALNVSGSLYVGGQNFSSVCLSNGTNCPPSLGGANLTANGATTGYIPQFQNASVLNNSVIYQNNSNIGIGMTNPRAKLHVTGGINVTTDVCIDGGKCLSLTSTSSGTVTSITAGTGLVANASPITTTGMINVSASTCQGANNVSVYNGTGFNCTPISGGTYTADNYTLTLTGTQFTLNTTKNNDSINTISGALVSTRVLNASMDASQLAQNNTYQTLISERVLNSTLSNYMPNSSVWDYVSYRMLNTSFDTSQSNQNTTYQTLISARILNSSAVSCVGANNVSVYNGTGFNCTPISGGTGTVTSITAGTGLVANASPITTTGMINVSASTCRGANNVSVYNGTGFNCTPVTAGTYTADNYTLTLTGTQFTFNSTWGNATYTNISKVGTVTNTNLCHGNGSAVQCDDASVTMSTTAHSISATNFSCTGCINGTQLADNIWLDNNLSMDTNTFFIDITNDRVGIGTISPGAKLSVISTTGDGNPQLIIGDTGSSTTNFKIMRNTATGNLDFTSMQGAYGYTFMSGNVGIGTTAPVATLTVSGNLSVNGTTNSSLDSGTLFIDATNNRVGIGTTSPGAKLDVSGTDTVGIRYTKNAADARIQVVDSTKAWSMASGWTGTGSGAGDFAIIEEGANGWLTIRQGGNTTIDAPSGTLFVDATNDRVGIGTTSPSSKFSVGGNGDFNDSLSITGYATIYTHSGALELGYSGGNAFVTGYNRSGGIYIPIYIRGHPIYIAENGSTGYALTVDNGGYVGIGTTNPVAPLDVKYTGGAFAHLGDYTNGWALEETSNAYFHISEADSGISTLTRRITIAHSTGYVGIGAIGPEAQLTVVGAGQTSGNFNTAGALGGTLFAADSGTGAGNGGAIMFSANSQAWRFAAIKGYVTNGGDSSTGDLTFSVRKVSTDATLTEAMRILNTGNVGIGTAGPDARLDVLDAGGAEQLRLTYTDGSAFGNITVDSSGNMTLKATGGNVIIRLG